MPAVVAAAAGMAAGAAVATGMGLVAGTMAYAITAGVTSMVVSSVVGGALGGNEQPQQQQANAQAAQMARGILVNTASTIDPIQVIYGSRRIGGTRVLTEVSGANNEYLNLVISHCEGPVSAINTVYIDGVASTDSRFTGLVDIEKHLGALDQVASAALIAELPGVWTSAHQGCGVAYTWVRLKYDQNVFRGLPVITADIDGRMLYDDRDGLTKFSDNNSLCIKDYLTNTLYGRGIPTANIDTASFISAANTCDITYDDPAAVARPQHTCNGVVDTSQNSTENIRSLLTACRGTLLFSARGYGLLIDKAETPTTFEFNEDNIVGSWNIGTGSKRKRFNRVRGNWFNPDREWQPDIWPADSPTFRTTDNGLLLEAQLPLPFTDNAYEAQIKTERHMRQSRFGKTLAFRATIAGMDCEVGDVVPVTHSTPDYTSKPFRVQTIRLFSSDEVEVEMTEYDDSVYSDTPLTTPRTSPVTNLPDPFTVGVPGVPTVTEDLYETRESAGVKAKMTLTCGAAVDAFVAQYQFEWRLAGAPAWNVLPPSSSLTVDIYDVAPGLYDARVKAINSMGVSSAYATRSNAEIYGLLARPVAITGLSLQAAGGLAILTFDQHADMDVRRGGSIRFRHATETSGATWESSVSIGEAVNGAQTVAVLPLKSGTYLCKAIDSSGLTSVDAVSISTKQATALTFSTLLTAQEDSTFTGTHSNTYVDGVALKLAGVGLFDDIPDFDAVASLDSYGGVQTSGTYTFATGMDLGSVKHARLTSTIGALIINVNDQIDSRTALIDTWTDFDGTAGADADCYVETRETDDDPAGTPTWSAWKRLDAAEFEARGFEFRARLTTSDPSYNISISSLRVTAAEVV